MERAVLLGLTTALLLALVAGQEGQQEQCGECDRSTCEEIGSCPGGIVMDVCGCCQVCARGLGQRCDLTGTNMYGACGEYLECKARTDIGATTEATCLCEEEGSVCGSDGVTYESLCHLLQQTAETPELFVSVRGPCQGVPKIKSAPEDKVRPEGSILVLDCEAVGYPVPEISWELHRPDGSSLKLPSDDSSFAVQVRGGPEKHMVTGWVQIMRITRKSVGIYTCVATNEIGEVRSSASVSLDKSGENERFTNTL